MKTDGIQNGRWVYWMVAAILLAIPAFLINLGMHPFIEDEAIRATVAMEMKYSDNYILPTNNGRPYLFKPPVYNWVLVGMYTITGTINEWTTRIPTLLFLIFFAGFIYRVHRKYFSAQLSCLAAAMYLTCGRILFWDGFLGLIDVSYSLLTYAMMIGMYYLGKQKKYTLLYITAYGLSSVGFLMKGYPSLVFLGGSLLACAFCLRERKWLWHYGHVIGIALMTSIIGGYYFILSSHIELGETVAPLLEQSTRRTILNHKVSEVLLHILTYPIENIYHFLPWTAMVVLLFRSKLLSLLKINGLAYYSAVCFLCNILVYWVSPEVYPRYILMLTPLFFTVLLQVYQAELWKKTWRLSTVEWIFTGMIILAGILLIASLFHPSISTITEKTILVSGGISLLTLGFAYRKWATPLLWTLVICLLIIRIVFNLVLVPIRTAEDDATRAKADAQKIITLA